MLLVLMLSPPSPYQKRALRRNDQIIFSLNELPDNDDSGESLAVANKKTKCETNIFTLQTLGLP